VGDRGLGARKLAKRVPGERKTAKTASVRVSDHRRQGEFSGLRAWSGLGVEVRKKKGKMSRMKDQGNARGEVYERQ